MKLKVTKEYNFSKVGMNEVEGLADAMKQAMVPVQEFVKDRTYWLDTVELTEAEYKSRDGYSGCFETKDVTDLSKLDALQIDNLKRSANGGLIGE